MSEKESELKAARVDELTLRLAKSSDVSNNSEPLAFWVPGRIEVLGKHTDYGGGRSLLCAVERGICVVARARGDGSTGADSSRMRLLDVRSGESAEFDISADIKPRPGHWSNYPITVARRVAANFGGPVRGADIVFSSDLPPAAGVSSSSALVVAIFLVLSTVNDLPARDAYRANIRTTEDLAGYLGAVENGLDFKALTGQVGVGTFGGSEDHTAILCSRPGAVVQYTFSPVTFERAIALPSGYSFVIGASGVLAEKTGAALQLYNGVSRRLSVGLEAWRRASGRSDVSMGAAVSSSSDARERIRAALAASQNTEYPAQSLVERFDQFVTESNEIIPAAGDALARGDLESFGKYVAQSQHGAEAWLENQIPATIALVHDASKLGAVAASAFGAGFGGSVWALVESRSADAFRQQWLSAYKRTFPENVPHSEFFVTRAGPPAARL